MTAYFEFSAALLGLIQGLLVMFNKRSNWIAYVLQMIFLMLFSFSVALYGDVLNCIVYIFMGVWGFLLWKPSENEIKITTYTNQQRTGFGLLLFTAFLAFSAYLKTTDDPLYIMDSLTTSSSFLATYFMVRRKLEAWVVWFFNDILYMAVYFMLENQAWYLLALNAVWTVMAVLSYFNWKKIMEKNNV